MGGLGSGRRSRTDVKALADRCRRIEVAYLRRRGLLAPGASATLTWTRRGHPTGSALVDVLGRDRLRISYHDRRADGAVVGVHQDVTLERTRCFFGGERPWMCCPLCARRAGSLYQGAGGFACRRCVGLGYTSQRKDAPGRLMARAKAIRRRLGGTGALLADFPPRPTGMHWSTYRRLRERGHALELRAWAALLELFAKWDRQLARRFP